MDCSRPFGAVVDISEIECLSLGLIIDWNVIFLKDGLQRVVRNHPEELKLGHR